MLGSDILGRNIPFKQSLVIIYTTAALLIVTILYLKLSVAYALFGGVVVTSTFSLINGYKIIELLSFIKNDLKRSCAVIKNMILIGMIIGVWLCSGVIPVTVQLGLRAITPDSFLVTTFLTCTVLSVILGTGIGTISTAGVVLIMISKSLSIPDYITAGAIISGSYILCLPLPY